MRGFLLIAACTVGSAALFVVGCNSLLGFDDYRVDAEAGSGAEGGTEAGADGPEQRECTTNADCVKTGDFTICRKQDFKCAKLLSPDCPQVVGDWKNDNAVILGSILPVIGIDKAGSIPIFNAVALAVDEFRVGANGLPPAAGTSERRPIVVVSCSEESDDENDVDAPVRSAHHLVDDVKVPAIIGASFSGNTQAVSQVTIPAGVLIISPTATSVAITDLDDKGLVWRTAPSDVIQAQALIKIMKQVETRTRTRLGLLPAEPLRVLMVHKGDSYGKGLAAALQAQLVFNEKSALENLASGTLTVVDYGDPPDYPAARNAILPKIGSMPPAVVFLLGTNEVVPEFLDKLEADATWPGGKKPTYLLTDGVLVPELWGSVGTNTELRTRCFGTVPGSDNSIFRLFKSRYNSFVKDGTSPDVGGTSAGYDALYLLAYAIAANPSKPVTGANINEGFKRLVPPGTLSEPGSVNINTAFSILSSGKNLDYNGASGPLDFDVVKGEAPSDIQVWCLPTEDLSTTGKAAPGVASGIFFDAAKGQIAGPTLDPLDPKVKATCNFP